MPAGVILFLVQNRSYHDFPSSCYLERYSFHSTHSSALYFSFFTHDHLSCFAWCRSLSRGLGPPTPAPNIDMLLSPGCGGCGGCGGWEPELDEERSGPGHAEGENS